MSELVDTPGGVVCVEVRNNLSESILRKRREQDIAIVWHRRNLHERGQVGHIMEMMTMITAIETIVNE